MTMKKMTKAERIYKVLYIQCEDIVVYYGFEDGQTIGHFFYEYDVCTRTLNAMLKLVESEESHIRMSTKLGIMSDERAEERTNIIKMVRATIEKHKANLQKWNKELKTPANVEEIMEETVPETEHETAETVEQTEEQHITNTETAKSENVPHKTKTILVGKDAYFYLKNEQKKQRGCKPIYDDEKNNRFWEKQVTKFDGKARLGDDSFGGGDGTYDGRWWRWNVETLKAMLDKAGYSYEDGDEIEYLNV